MQPLLLPSRPSEMLKQTIPDSRYIEIEDGPCNKRPVCQEPESNKQHQDTQDEHDLGLPAHFGPYATRKQLIEAINDYGRSHGYGVWLGPTQGIEKSGVLKCDRFGQHEVHRPALTEATRQRAVRTKKKGCTFRLYAYQRRQDIDVLNPRPFYFRVVHGTHSHAAIPPEELGPQRRATESIKVFVQSMLKGKCKTSQILTALDEHFPGHNLPARQIRYIRERMSAEMKKDERSTQ